eukprot:CAMPEP_0172506562 /NCGR_PEP_ID=MMETSP1066-20121228/196112_1 /TAXON_ID=671091 /ORGANISM="Coscinodiscus wailesii, Strain CCMP2513" /LENGTH=476 /DNA_ID=CAMNT_0013283641 /DNA_START=110 /DNA_END=1540 /DNA_ORIENTATION=-
MHNLGCKYAEWAERTKRIILDNNSRVTPDLNDEIEELCARYVHIARDMRETYQRRAGNLLTCGSGDCGQFGMGEDLLNAKSPIVIDSVPDKVTLVAGGGLHNVVLTQSGNIFTWGCSDDGGVGVINGTDDSPNRVSFGEGDTETMFWVAAGDTQTLAVSHVGKVYMCGSYKDKEGKSWRDIAPPHQRKQVERDGKPYVPSRGKHETPIHVYLLTKKVDKVACGASFNAAKCVDGSVLTWGMGECGELGRKVAKVEKDGNGNYNLEAITNDYLTPLPPTWAGGNAIPVDQISCGGFHFMVITDLLHLYTTGLNNYGQLGHGDIESRDTLTRVEALANKRVARVAGGFHHTLCLTQDGNAFSFGRGDSGQLGVTDTLPASGYCEMAPVPVTLPDAEKGKDISCGSNHCLLMSENGNVYTWGYGDLGALGHGKEKDEFRPKKLNITRKLENAKNAVVHQIVGGGQHSVFVASYTNEAKN